MTYDERKQLAIDYIKTFDVDIDGLLNFWKFYSFSTENLTNTFTKDLLENKNVLVTGSSADQIITSQLYNSCSITNYDINPFVEFIYDLKISAIKALNIDEYINYFYYRDTNKSSLNYNKYEKIREYMSGYSLKFWDELYNLFRPLKIRRKLFTYTDEQEDRNNYKKLIPYLSEENYNKMKTKELIPVNFITCNVLDICKLLSDKYDLIYFSNIFARIEMNNFYKNNYVRETYNFINNILKYTNENGKLLLNYFYYCKKEDFNSKNDMLHRINFLIRIFNCEENISYKEVPSIYDNEKDTVLIYTKKNK